LGGERSFADVRLEGRAASWKQAFANGMGRLAPLPYRSFAPFSTSD